MVGFSWVVYPIQCELWGFLIWLLEIHNIPGLLWILGTFSANPFERSFLGWPQAVFSQVCAYPNFAEFSNGERILCRYPGFPPCVALSFLIFCPVNSSHLGQLHLLKSRSPLGSVKVPISPCRSLETLLRQYAGAVVGLISFVSHVPGIAVLHYLMSTLLKKIFFPYLLSFLFGSIVLGRRLNLVFVTLSWIGFECHFAHLLDTCT